MQIPIRRLFPRLLAAGLTLLSCVCVRAAPLDDMVAFDARYIPALALSSQAAQDGAAAPKARASLGALHAQWPALKQRLASTWGEPAPAGWAVTLARVEQRIAAALAASAHADWKGTHEALEPVRIDLMDARQRQGLDYFVDRLTAYHAPMETLALAGSTLQPGQLDATRRAELEQAYTRARVLWRGIEQAPLDTAAQGLSVGRRAQLRSALDAETAALARLSEALRTGDNAALLKAAAALKPPYARAFMSFGRFDTAQLD